MTELPQLASVLQAKALSIGFAEAAVVDWQLAKEEYSQHASRYREWVDRGDAGEMSYLVRGSDRRRDPLLVYPELQSIAVVMVPYQRSHVGSENRDEGVRYARYLVGDDYHQRMKRKMELWLESVRDSDPSFEKLKWKICVDTSAVLERTWGAIAGLGWIGKNTLLIHPRHGSYFFIGVAFLNQASGLGPSLMANYCGHCSRCLTSCPTEAFREAGSLDARKCISYLTLEKRGEFSPEEQQRVASSNWVAGCDICQEVCPFNHKPSRMPNPLVEGRDVVSASHRWEFVEAESDAAYEARIAGTALDRVSREQFKRNLAAIQSARRIP